MAQLIFPTLGFMKQISGESKLQRANFGTICCPFHLSLLIISVIAGDVAVGGGR